MIAVDTNILVYAHREDASLHKEADTCLTRLAEGGRTWAIPWPCLHEFLAIVTHPRIYSPPTPLSLALEQVTCWLESPTLAPLAETEGYWKILSETVTHAKIRGPQIHDARIAALCLHHAVTELWTADRDFGRFKALRIRNPLA